MTKIAVTTAPNRNELFFTKVNEKQYKILNNLIKLAGFDNATNKDYNTGECEHISEKTYEEAVEFFNYFKEEMIKTKEK